MYKSYADYFGRMLVENVRQRTILSFDRVVDKRVVGDTGEKYRQLMEGFSEQQLKIIQDNIVPDLVDKCLCEFLRMIDISDDIDIVVKSKTCEKKLSDINNNMATAYTCKDGWKDLYTN